LPDGERSGRLPRELVPVPSTPSRESDLSMSSRVLPPTLVSAALFLFLLVPGCQEPEPGVDVQAAAQPSTEQPEAASGYEEKPGWATSEFAVAAANPLATEAGYRVILEGGSAVDAAVAVQMVLTLVEPQSSGIGGGAFLLYWDGSRVHAYDGRETAPAAADETLFLDEGGEPLPFGDAVVSGLSVGVPGTVAMLAQAHAEHGSLSWAELFDPAIRLAEEGFELSPRLQGQLDRHATLPLDPIARSLYYDEDGEAHPVGYLLRNPALAEVLRRIAQEGPDAFYHGPVAEDIVARVQGHPERPGAMTVEDLARYPEEDFSREALCSPWREYRLCGFPPPSSGHLAIGQILGILDELDLPGDPLDDGVPSAEWLHAYMEASRLAFADRALYVADPAFVDPPAGNWESLLDPSYLQTRARLVGPESMGEAEAGDPGAVAFLPGVHPVQPDRGTSHLSLVDREGNAVAMTMTIEQGFGSRIMSDGGTGLPGGFHLNNELTDFSRVPADAAGRPIANRVEAGKRPRSSMSPTLVFDGEGGDFVASLGSPGGAGIIHYTAKTLIGMLDWGLDAQAAIDLPNFASYNGPSILEEGRFGEVVIQALRARGHQVQEQTLTSGLQAIQRTEDGGLFGGADPRREGIVMGR
jgi:gamma-glutamyltranspeptidase / glutathione hydrolase